MTGNRKLFVNLAVRELQKSTEFFSKLGFEFDKRNCPVRGPGSSFLGEVEELTRQEIPDRARREFFQESASEDRFQQHPRH